MEELRVFRNILLIYFGNILEVSVGAAGKGFSPALEFGGFISFISPAPGYHVGAFAEIHRHHRELQTGAALQKEDRVVVGYGQKAFEAGLSLTEYLFEGRRAVTDLKNGHSAAVKVPELFLNLFHDFLGKLGRAGAEIIYLPFYFHTFMV